MNCKCNSPDTSESIQIGLDGRLKQMFICDSCGGQVYEDEDNTVNAKPLLPEAETDTETR